MHDEVSLDDEERSKEKALRFTAATASNKSIKAMLSLAQSELPILPDELDQNSWFLNCPNGTLDLRTGMLFNHRRQDFITKLCPTEFNRTAETYDWDRFMEEVHNHEDLIRWCQRWYGYCLTGDVREHVLPIYYGCGANGKSTEIEAYMNALGSDYAMKAPPDLLLLKKNDSHPTERADLFGKRFVACVEAGDGRKLNEPLIKELTGGDSIRARWMHENFWEFRPSYMVILCTNHKPVVRGTDNAIWRRLRLNPFGQVFTEAQQDKGLSEKLQACAEGILAWAVEGCLDWQKNGLGTAADMTDATLKYRSSQDVVGSFIADRCVQHTQFKVRSKQIFEEFERWCAENGETEISRKKFGQQIKGEGFERFTNNGVWYRGIAIGTEGTEP
jgi:putative DNA primase/helicase